MLPARAAQATRTSRVMPSTRAAASIWSSLDAWRRSKSRSTWGVCPSRRRRMFRPLHALHDHGALGLTQKTCGARAFPTAGCMPLDPSSRVNPRSFLWLLTHTDSSFKLLVSSFDIVHNTLIVINGAPCRRQSRVSLRLQHVGKTLDDDEEVHRSLRADV